MQEGGSANAVTQEHHWKNKENSDSLPHKGGGSTHEQTENRKKV